LGRAMAFLMELRLDEGPLGAEEAERRLLEWWSTERSAGGAAGGASSGGGSPEVPGAPAGPVA
jgi:poly(A) polymerase